MMLLVSLTGCASGQTPQAPAPATAISPSAGASLAAGCGLISVQEVGEITGLDVDQAHQARAQFELAGMAALAADQCAFTIENEDHLQGLVVRLTPDGGEELFTALARYDTGAGLERVSPAGANPASFWQPVGRTFWLRRGDRAAAVTVVTRAAATRDRRIAERLATRVVAG